MVDGARIAPIASPVRVLLGNLLAIVGTLGIVQIANPVGVLLGSLLAIVGGKASVQIATHASARGESLQGIAFGRTVVAVVTLDRPSAQTNKHCANGLREHTPQGGNTLGMLSQPVEL